VTRRRQFSRNLKRLKEDVAKSLSEHDCYFVGLTGAMQVQPIKRNVSRCVRNSVVLVLHTIMLH
jgi:hypothetical protein